MQINQLPSTSTVNSTDLLVKEQANGTTQKIAISDFVVNNLTSTSTDKPLSAAQGKALNDTIGSKSDLSYVSNASIVAAINSVAGWFQNSSYKFVTGYVAPSAASTIIQQIQAAINDITTDSKPVQFVYHVYSTYHCSVSGVLYAGKNYGCGLYCRPDGTLKYWLMSNNTLTTYTITKTAD